jgi:hypothetical protein
MQISKNPYSPGAGRKPVALTGREKQRETWRAELLRIENGLDSRPMSISGLRGIGKTVLLSTMHDMALSRGWIAARFEANGETDLRNLLSREFEVGFARIMKPSPSSKILSALKTMGSFSTSFGFPGIMTVGFDLKNVEGKQASTNNLSRDLQSLISEFSVASEEMGVGVALLIDEAQELSKEEMSALSELMQRASLENWRFSMALAGLPSLPTLLAEAKSYAERQYSFWQLDPLNHEDALEALTAPAKSQEVAWEDRAAKKIIEASGGYPYFLQEYGSACWQEADGSPISLDDVNKGIPQAQKQLDMGFFATRWERATAAQKEYLRAMAQSGEDECATKSIVQIMGHSAKTLSPRRSELIKKGIIYAPRQGVVAFTVPLMAQYINRHHSE